MRRCGEGMNVNLGLGRRRLPGVGRAGRGSRIRLRADQDASVLPMRDLRTRRRDRQTRRRRKQNEMALEYDRRRCGLCIGSRQRAGSRSHDRVVGRRIYGEPAEGLSRPLHGGQSGHQHHQRRQCSRRAGQSSGLRSSPNNVTWDIVDMVAADAITACDEGLIMEIDPDTWLAPGSRRNASVGGFLRRHAHAGWHQLLHPADRLFHDLRLSHRCLRG